MMLPFLAGLGIKSWVHEYATPLMWTAAVAIAALVAYSDRLPRLRAAKHQTDKHRENSFDPLNDTQQTELNQLREEKRIAVELRSQFPILTINSAVYGAGHVGKEDLPVAPERLRVRNALAMRVQNSALVPRNPADNDKKRIIVKYSFENANEYEATFWEGDLMVIPVPSKPSVAVEIEDWYDPKALNLKLLNGYEPKGLDAQLLLNSVERWDTGRAEFMGVRILPKLPVSLTADNPHLTFGVKRMFQLIQFTDNIEPPVEGPFIQGRIGEQVLYGGLPSQGIYRLRMTLSAGGKSDLITKCFKWEGHGTPIFFEGKC